MSKPILATLPVLCETMVYHTKPYNDPRLTIYGQPASQGPYKGEYFGQNISYGGSPTGFQQKKIHIKECHKKIIRPLEPVS